MAAGPYGALIYYPDGEPKVRTIFAAPEIGGPIVLVEDDREGWFVKDAHDREGELNGKAYQFEIQVELRPED